MRDLSHEIALLEMRLEQLHLHLQLVRAGSLEARNIRSLLAAMLKRKKALEGFTLDQSYWQKEMVLH